MNNKPDMRGKICMVTGATTGIGKITALRLAEMGATVIVVGRSLSKGDATVNEIKARTGNQAVEFMQCDLSSQASIRQLAANFTARHSQLHVLVNNAGAVNFARLLTVDGLETTFAVNHLAYFLLTNLLLDVLKASAPSRIVNVSSQAQTSGVIDFDDLQGEKRFTGMRSYSQSKLANVMFTYALAKRLEGTGVTVNALHPGVVRTGFARNNGPLFKLGVSIVGRFFLSPEKGAETTVYLASSPDVEGVTGKYFIKKKPVGSAPASYDEAAAERLWQVSVALTGLALGV